MIGGVEGRNFTSVLAYINIYLKITLIWNFVISTFFHFFLLEFHGSNFIGKIQLMIKKLSLLKEKKIRITKNEIYNSLQLTTFQIIYNLPFFF